jgi:competence protein ComEA
MHKLITLLVALLMVSLNAFAAVNVNTASEELRHFVRPSQVRSSTTGTRTAFKAVDDLTKVPGIGAGVLSKIRSEVTLTGSTTPAAPANKICCRTGEQDGAPAPANKIDAGRQRAGEGMPAPPAAPATPR